MSSKFKSVEGMLTSVDSLFTTQAERDDMAKPKVEEISLDLIDGFEGHPFSVKDDEDMQKLLQSIAERGVLVPCLARQNGERYELISGHRRKAACRTLGISTLPVIVKDMTREEAIITMVDSNVQREHILPSEKAMAYKMKMDALSHQGKTSCQLGTKLRTDQEIADTANESARQVQRYIRLTYLNKSLLDMVDEGRIAFTPAVELSYLNEIEQQDLVETIAVCECTPNLSQACRLKAISQGKGLNPEDITAIMSEQKANQKPMFKIRLDKLREVAPKIKDNEFEAFVIKACDHYYKYQQKQKRQEAR